MHLISDGINDYIDSGLTEKAEQQPPREYLGASRLGVSCSRALQYEYLNTPRDYGVSGQILRIFEIGHAFEKMALQWLTDAGFEIRHSQNSDKETLGFSTANNQIQGHVDGIIIKSPLTDMGCPALWECKSMNAQNWKKTREKGMRTAKPVYAVQIALYQAYMNLNEHPALFTAVNKDTADLYHELVPFDAALAQEASDRGVHIVRAIRAHELLPRISQDKEYFECRFCPYKDTCWKGTL